MKHLRKFNESIDQEILNDILLELEDEGFVINKQPTFWEIYLGTIEERFIEKNRIAFSDEYGKFDVNSILNPLLKEVMERVKQYASHDVSINVNPFSVVIYNYEIANSRIMDLRNKIKNLTHLHEMQMYGDITEPATKINYNSWIIPDDDTLRREFKVEHQFHKRNYFNSIDEFLEAVKNSSTMIVTPDINSRIRNRSNTKSPEQLLRLIKCYASYPQYRNEDTLKTLYTRIQTNKPLDMPIVLQRPNGTLRVFSGNTRMDVAFQLGVNPHVLLVKSN